MNILQKVLLPGLLLASAGCAQKPQTVLSGDTAYEMQSSIVTLSATLPDARKDEFDQAIETIVFAATDRRLGYTGSRFTPQTIRALQGRSVHQVIEDAKLLRAAARF